MAKRKVDTFEVVENRYQYIMDKINENIDYIHYSNYNDVYDQILGSSVKNTIEIRKNKNIDNTVKIINNYLSIIFNESIIGDVTASRGANKNTKVIKDTILNIEDLIDTKDIISLAILMLQQPETANRFLKNNNNLLKSGNYKKLRLFVSIFGGEIKFKSNKDKGIEMIVVPPSKNRDIGAFSIDDVENYANIVKDAINEIEINNEAYNTLQGTMAEIGGAILVAQALAQQEEFYSTTIKNLGKKSKASTSYGQSRIIIDDKETKNTLRNLQKKLENIRKILERNEDSEIKINDVFSKQGKVDFSVGDLNFSAKSYWSDDKFKLSGSSGQTLASLASLMMAYYPEYGYKTTTFNIFLNLLALRNGEPSNLGNQLIKQYKKIIKNLIIGYDVDILFLSRNGVPIALNAWDAYETDRYFKLIGNFHFKNTFSQKKNKNEAAIARSERIFYNIMSSRYKVEGNVK